MQEISQKARQVLEYLTQRESSIPPTVREIGAALQIKSTSTVHKYLTELAAAGYIEKGDKMNVYLQNPRDDEDGKIYARMGTYCYRIDKDAIQNALNAAGIPFEMMI